MTAHLRIKPTLRTQRSSSSRLHSSLILSEEEIIFWFFAKVSNGKIRRSKNWSLTTPILERLQKRSLMLELPKNLGMESNKNILSFRKKISSNSDLMDGLVQDILLKKVFSIARLEVMFVMDVR